MSKALRNTLGAIERAIGIDAGGREDRVWVSAEDALASRERIFELVGGLFPGVPWKVAAVRERIARAFPVAGHWGKVATADEQRVLREHLAQLKATDGTCPWRPTPPLLDLAAADYGVVGSPYRS